MAPNLREKSLLVKRNVSICLSLRPYTLMPVRDCLLDLSSQTVPQNWLISMYYCSHIAPSTNELKLY